jgi:hypothetical protein
MSRRATCDESRLALLSKILSLSYHGRTAGSTATSQDTGFTLWVPGPKHLKQDSERLAGGSCSLLFLASITALATMRIVNIKHGSKFAKLDVIL